MTAKSAAPRTWPQVLGEVGREDVQQLPLLWLVVVDLVGLTTVSEEVMDCVDVSVNEFVTSLFAVS